MAEDEATAAAVEPETEETAAAEDTPAEERTGLLQFVARVRTDPEKENWYAANFTMEDVEKVEEPDVRAVIEAEVGDTAERKLGEITVSAKIGDAEEASDYTFLYIYDPENTYWSALRASGTEDEVNGMRDAIDKLHLEALKPLGERAEVEWMQHWSDILGSYASAVEIVEDKKEVISDDAPADDTAATEEAAAEE